MADLKVGLKKAGLQIPPPSKKEQWSQRRQGETKVSDDWVVSLTFDVDPSMETMDCWETQLEGLDGSVARIPGRGIQITTHASGGISVIEAAEKMANEVMHIVHAEPVSMEVGREAKWQRRADEPTLPELMSAAEIAEELGISRQRVHQLRRTAMFPGPLADLRGGAVWDAAAVRKFSRDWKRQPGRPAGAGDGDRKRAQLSARGR